MDFGILITAIAGAGFGYWFFVQNKMFIMSLVYNFRLIADPEYRSACLNLLESENFYKDAKPEYDVLPRSEHFDAVIRTRDKIGDSLAVFYRVVLKHIGTQAFIWGIGPLVLFAVFSTAQYFMTAVLIALTIATLYEVIFMHKPGFALHMRLRALLVHAYADAGYRTRKERAQKVATPEPKESQPELMVPAPAMLVPAPPVQAMETSATASHLIEYVDDEDDDDDIVIPQPKAKKRLPKLTLSTVWWGTDALVSVMIILNYWISDADSFMDVLVMPLWLILIIQVFFVPMWFILKIALKLIAPKSYS